jgi:hypothetical protein
MKLTLVSLFFALTAFAQERVVLDRSDILVSSDSAVLVRTSETPDKINLRMTVPMSDSACLRTATRQIQITSASRCGTAPVRSATPRSVSYCVRRNPGNGACLRYETRYEYPVIHVARTCTVLESYCAERGILTNQETDGVVIKFKNANSLPVGTEETFAIKAQQNHTDGTNVLYDLDILSAQQEYEVNIGGFLGSDKITIKGK